MLRPLRALVALVLVAFALTGCMKLDMDLTIDGDSDTINGTMIFAMDKEILTMGGKSPEDSFKESADDFDDDLPKGSRSEIYDDGEFYGEKIIFQDVPLAEFSTSDEGPRIVHQDGKYIFTLDADMSAGEASEDDKFAQLLGPMLKTIEFKIAVTFPGEVTEVDEHGKLEGRTVTWTLKMDEQYDLRAVSQEGDSIPSWLLFAAVAGLFGILVVAGIIVLIVRMNRSSRQPALAAAGAEPGTAGPTLAPPGAPAATSPHPPAGQGNPAS